jgi:hypothetical protein
MVKKMFLFIFPILSIFSEQDYRKWKNQEGKIIEAKFVKFNKEKVEIKRKDGFTFTISPTAFSQEDQEYLTELKKRTDSRGYLWNSTSAKFELVSQKWFDSPKDRAILHYHEFKRDRVDIDKDGQVDGLKVLKKANGGVFTDTKILAWDVTEDGKLLFRYPSLGKIQEGIYKYDFDSKSFVRIEGYGPSFFISAER